jgi:hypothetical protein
MLLPASIGVVTAFAGYLTACGSKFWQENWEAHVDLLEDQTQRRLTQVIVGCGAPQFSVSRVNQAVLLLLTVAWGLVAIVAAVPAAGELITRIPPMYRGVTVLVVLLLICSWMRFSRVTRLNGREFRFGDANWVEIPSHDSGMPKRKDDPFIIWRDLLGEQRLRKPDVPEDGSM